MKRALLLVALVGCRRHEAPPPPPPPVEYDAGPQTVNGAESTANEDARTVPNAEHPALALPPNCVKLQSLNATLAACKNIPDKDRAALRDTIESIPATLDGIDPDIATAVDHACSLSLETLTTLARDCPALVDELHKKVANVELAPGHTRELPRPECDRLIVVLETLEQCPRFSTDDRQAVVDAVTEFRQLWTRSQHTKHDTIDDQCAAAVDKFTALGSGCPGFGT
ncbi:MAG TPA: hypothetical protein VGM39_21920 [Kofleriaceae bacterium]|jgi:hypothetical protein